VSRIEVHAKCLVQLAFLATPKFVRKSICKFPSLIRERFVKRSLEASQNKRDTRKSNLSPELLQDADH
jgi:hypothetical protein